MIVIGLSGYPTEREFFRKKKSVIRFPGLHAPMIILCPPPTVSAPGTGTRKKLLVTVIRFQGLPAPMIIYCLPPTVSAPATGIRKKPPVKFLTIVDYFIPHIVLIVREPRTNGLEGRESLQSLKIIVNFADSCEFC